ncbi:serine O-acetyltransferase [Arthrobacter sp. CG_A4]|uniref:serine O-acetyltransferase n=1 Tax=Arthrobacter sp. CG_A4 TaxID=3071706 RepID=UPI002E149E0F
MATTDKLGQPGVEIVNSYELRVTVASGPFYTALHLLNGRETVEKTPYSRGKTFSFFIREPGNYRVKTFTRVPGAEVSTSVTDSVRVDGLRDIGVPKDPWPIVLAGINRTTAAALHTVNDRREIAGILDPTGQLVGSKFFGAPVIGWDDVAPGCALWVPKGLTIDAGAAEFEAFELETGARDVLSAELFRMGVMDVYRKSCMLYELDLTRGATYLQNFIFHHFSCRLPYKVQLGEGTRLGYNGLGTVFHPESIVGRNCLISQNVTLGSRGKTDDMPNLGDNVYVGPGAKCLGGKIGSNVVVGANAVVLNSVPDNCVVAGVPAKIISRDMGSYASYTGEPV